MPELTIHYAQHFFGVTVFDFSLVAPIQSKTDILPEKQSAESLAMVRTISSKALGLWWDHNSSVPKKQ